MTDIAVDDGAVYWSDASIEGKGFIKRVALDDGTETTLATDLDGFVSSLTVDSTHLHWAQSEPIKLMRAPLQGGTATELFRNESGDHPSLVMTKEGVVASGFTIPVAASGQQILLFPFDGGTPRLLASAPAIMHIASNGERVYFTTPGEDGAVQSILSVALQGGTPEVVADRVPYLMAIAAYGDVLCWIRTVELSEIVCRKV